MDVKTVYEGSQGFIVGEGQAGMDMFDDTMSLALAHTIKQAYLTRTMLSLFATAGVCFGANTLDSKVLAAGAGALAIIAFQQRIRAIGAKKEYNKRLDEAELHGWASRQQLETINWRYL